VCNGWFVLICKRRVAPKPLGVGPAHGRGVLKMQEKIGELQVDLSIRGRAIAVVAQLAMRLIEDMIEWIRAGQ